jgi:hypothetical protein
MMAILLNMKIIYKFNALTIKISSISSLGIDKHISKFIWKCNKGPRITKTILRKKKKAG